MLTTGGDGNNQVPPSNPYQVYCLLPLAQPDWAFAILGSLLRPTSINFVCAALCAAVSSCSLRADLLEPRFETFSTLFQGDHFWRTGRATFSVVWGHSEDSGRTVGRV
jgi:hypothetical protein